MSTTAAPNVTPTNPVESAIAALKALLNDPTAEIRLTAAKAILDYYAR